MNTLSEIIHTARAMLGEENGKVLAAVPTIASDAVSINNGNVLGLNHGLMSGANALYMARGRKRTKHASAFSQSKYAHLMVILLPDTVAIHQLKIPNKAAKLIEVHPVSAFFYEQNPVGGEIDTILTIAGNPFYVKRTFGPDLRATLAHHGIEPGLTADI